MVYSQSVDDSDILFIEVMLTPFEPNVTTVKGPVTFCSYVITTKIYVFVDIDTVRNRKNKTTFLFNNVYSKVRS
jgi:hypothetical protein